MGSNILLWTRYKRKKKWWG